MGKDLEHHILLSAACDRQGLGVNPLLTMPLFVRGGCSREKIVLVREAINYTLSEVVVVFYQPRSGMDSRLSFFISSE